MDFVNSKHNQRRSDFTRSYYKSVFNVVSAAINWMLSGSQSEEDLMLVALYKVADEVIYSLQYVADILHIKNLDELEYKAIFRTSTWRDVETDNIVVILSEKDFFVKINRRIFAEGETTTIINIPYDTTRDKHALAFAIFTHIFAKTMDVSDNQLMNLACLHTSIMFEDYESSYEHMKAIKDIIQKYHDAIKEYENSCTRFLDSDLFGIYIRCYMHMVEQTLLIGEDI